MSDCIVDDDRDEAVFKRSLAERLGMIVPMAGLAYLYFHFLFPTFAAHPEDGYMMFLSSYLFVFLELVFGLFAGPMDISFDFQKKRYQTQIGFPLLSWKRTGSFSEISHLWMGESSKLVVKWADARRLPLMFVSCKDAGAAQSLAESLGHRLGVPIASPTSPLIRTSTPRSNSAKRSLAQWRIMVLVIAGCFLLLGLVYLGAGYWGHNDLINPHHRQTQLQVSASICAEAITTSLFALIPLPRRWNQYIESVAEWKQAFFAITVAVAAFAVAFGLNALFISDPTTSPHGRQNDLRLAEYVLVTTLLIDAGLLFPSNDGTRRCKISGLGAFGQPSCRTEH